MEMVFHYNKSTANVQNIAQELIVVLVACLASSYRCILDTALVVLSGDQQQPLLVVQRDVCVLIPMQIAHSTA